MVSINAYIHRCPINGCWHALLQNTIIKIFFPYFASTQKIKGWCSNHYLYHRLYEILYCYTKYLIFIFTNMKMQMPPDPISMIKSYWKLFSVQFITILFANLHKFDSSLVRSMALDECGNATVYSDELILLARDRMGAVLKLEKKCWRYRHVEV